MTTIVKGCTVIRKADRKKDRPTTGTVERLMPPGIYSHRFPRAVVLWHGNVRMLDGRTDQRSKVKVDALLPWEQEA